ncbi:MAG: hypothetical protein KAG19_04900 [Methylococcales bacterium]|nr:hypothetical protein [Methylococcales bacterium]
MGKKITEVTVDTINGVTVEKKENDLLTKSLPWLFGVGIAAGHLVTASSCTIPQQGKCAVCGGCVVALGSLVAWAKIKNKNEGGYYDQTDDFR